MDILKKHLLGFVFVVGFLCSPCNAFSQAKLAVPVQVRDDMSNTDVCANFKATPSIQISLLFGTEISEGEWKKFVDTEIVPYFPEGLSIFSVDGRWQDRITKRVQKVPSRLVWISTVLNKDIYKKIEHIRSVYRIKFKQQSVGLIIDQGCNSF